MLRQNTQYCSLKIIYELVKVSLFADDTVIYLNDSATKFKHVFTVLKAFCSKSGGKISLSKSVMSFLLGSK